MGDTDWIRIRIPYRPKSKKNSRPIWKRKNGSRFLGTDPDVDKQAADIARLFREALGMAKGVAPWIAEDDVQVELWDLARSNAVEVVVRRLAPKPAGVNGRGKDLDNLTTSVLDALNGVAYTDDRQVARIVAERLLT